VTALTARHVRQLFVLGAAVGALAIAGVTAAPTGAAPGAAPQSTCAANPKLKQHTRITSLLVPYFGLEHIASARGFFQKYNLTVAFIPTVQGAGALPAIVSGQAQTLQSSTALTYLLAINAGVPVVGVASGYVDQNHYDTVRFIVNKDSNISSPKDLVGKTVGMPATLSYYSLALDAWLMAGGVDPSQVKLIAVPPLNQAQALLSGQIDMAAMGDVYYTNLLTGSDAWKVKTVFTDGEAIPAARKMVTAYVFRQDYAQQHPDVVCAYVAALRDAAKFVAANKIQAKQVISTVTAVEPRYIPIPSYPKNLCLDLNAATAYPPLMVKLGLIKEGLISSSSQWLSNKYNPMCK
jgi:ABC-type nitrate/sulfonate/bicarbonate transport system substrate-binding protein